MKAFLVEKSERRKFIDNHSPEEQKIGLDFSPYSHPDRPDNSQTTSVRKLECQDFANRESCPVDVNQPDDKTQCPNPVPIPVRFLSEHGYPLQDTKRRKIASSRKTPVDPYRLGQDLTQNLVPTSVVGVNAQTERKFKRHKLANRKNTQIFHYDHPTPNQNRTSHPSQVVNVHEGHTSKRQKLLNRVSAYKLEEDITPYENQRPAPERLIYEQQLRVYNRSTTVYREDDPDDPRPLEDVAQVPVPLVNGELTTAKKPPKCTKCANHGIHVRVKGHKKKCPKRNCRCDKCILVVERQYLCKQTTLLKNNPSATQVAVPYPEQTASVVSFPFPKQSPLTPQMYPSSRSKSFQSRKQSFSLSLQTYSSSRSKSS